MEIVVALLIGIYFVVGVVTALRDMICAPRCEHGVRNGNKRKSNGKLKCPECQIALEQNQKLIEEQKKERIRIQKEKNGDTE